MDWDSLTGCQGAQSRKEGQEDQGEIKELGGHPPSCFRVPWSSWPSFWLFPGLPINPSNLLTMIPAISRPFSMKFPI